MSVYIGDVQTFAGVIADKPQVLKIGEETMEVFSAWECWKNLPQSNPRRADLVNEIADVIQAACNLLAAVGVDDMRQPMQECYVRNVERGREYSSSGDSMDEQQDSIRTRPISNGTCPIDEQQNVNANDSREKLEAEVRFIAAINEDDEEGRELFEEMIIELLDRQAAITERECRKPNWDYCDTCETLKDVNFECEELQEQVDNQKKFAENFRDMWQKADARCSELKAENEALKTRIESLRSKISKMLDAASAIQHIGDLP